MICRRETRAPVALMWALICLLGANARAETRPPPGPRGASPGSAATTARNRRPSTAAAARTEPPVNQAALLSRVFEDKAMQILERYIPVKEFQVTATVVPSGKQLANTPYDPKGALSTGTMMNMEPEDLDAYVQRVTIDVSLNARLNNTRRKIEELLFKSLKLKRQRGDRVNFENLGIEVAPDEWMKERQDMKAEMSRMREENERMARELDAEKMQAKQQAQTGGGNSYWKTFMDKNGRLISILGILLGAVSMVALIALLLLGRSFAKTGKSLAGAIGNIGQAMEVMGGSIASAAQAAAERSNPAIGSLEAKMITDGKGSSGTGMAGLQLDTVHTHIMKTRQELLENFNENTEAIILKHLTNLASSPVTVGKAVVSLEVLGRETATQLFRRLGIDAQEAMLKFLHAGLYDRSKIEMMLEAGEEMKTKLLAESFDKIRGAASEKIAERLLQLTDEELVQVALDLDPEVLPRLFLYLDPGKIAGLLSNLKRADAEKFERTVIVLPKMPEVESLEQYDEEIMRALDAMIDRSKQDAQRPFLKVYQEIVEAADEEVGESIVRELSNNPRLDSYFRENIINLNTFFRLSEEARSQIIESLSNKDVAALATGVKEEDQDIILDNLPERRRALVLEEFDSLTSRGGRQATASFKRVKEVVVKKIKDMKADGVLTDVLKGTDGEELPDDDGRPGRKGPKRAA